MEKRKISVFLGGTCQGYDWRLKLIPMLADNIDYFDPYLRNGEPWDETAKLKERISRKTSDYVLYTLTSACIKIPYSIAEVVDDSNKRPFKTVLFFDLNGFNEKEVNSANEIKNLCKRNGATICESLEEVANFFNNLA